MCSKKDIEQITMAVSHMYKNQYQDAIVSIFLFGSYARGDVTPSSDVDIVAIVKGNRIELQEKLKNIWDETAILGLEYDVIISPSVIPYNEFEEYKTVLPYYRNIAKEGIAVGQ